MQSPQQTHQDHDTRSLPQWYQRFRMGPLGPLGLCAIAMGFIALLISGRLRMLYPMPRTVVASPQTDEPTRQIPPKPVSTGNADPSSAVRTSTGEAKFRQGKVDNAPERSASPGSTPPPAAAPPGSGEFETAPHR